MSMAFVVRLTWETVAQNWRIHLTPVNGDGVRLFCDSESLFLYIESQMLAEMTAAIPNNTEDREE